MKAFDDFDDFFEWVTEGLNCHRWQQELASKDECANRLIRIPTGFGKTLGVLAAWAWHRVILKDSNNGWPRRLVWCLPIRVLVEQTEKQVRSVLERLDVLWDGEESTHGGKVGVHLLMGGANAGQWHLYPESDAVLIGTQDMLLSRALNHGYASPRARWPMEFGLLNHDALWVMDEVQSMDTGLATSGQLQVFRDQDQANKKLMRPCFTWWMSATLQRTWLEKSPDTIDLVAALAQNMHHIQSKDRTGHLWDDVSKPLESEEFDKPNKLAHEIWQRHRDHGCGKEGPTLVVLNTVKLAVEIWKALKRDKELKKSGTDLRLIHSRFRPAERQGWCKEFLNREACGPRRNRIIVATQVVEAGVDISASLLVTELAPWPSLVQRFGRCARWGGTSRVLIADFKYDSDKKAAPYTMDELDAAREACEALQDVGVGPIHLEKFEEENQTFLPRLYPYEPEHLLRRHELDELFDTSPDLSGVDVDISRFIRSGEERDVQVFWAHVGKSSPPANLKSTREELCNVPFLRARDWLKKYDGKYWVWDWLSREWHKAKPPDIYPGQTVLVDSTVGGYDCEVGWDPQSSEQVPLVSRERAELLPEDRADAAEEDESLSAIDCWQTIASHGLQVAGEVEHIAGQLVPTQSSMLYMLQLAGRWHDLGKAHPAFQASIKKADDAPHRDDIAKAPGNAWRHWQDLYRIDSDDQRRGFRHELASTLGLFGVLQRHEPRHPALVGPWSALFDAIRENGGGHPTQAIESTRPTDLEREILNLDAKEFDLLAYLVCAHHGKVRMTWHASPADQAAEDQRLRIRGVREGDSLPPVSLAAADGGFQQLPATELDLSPSAMGLSTRTGRSWAERVLNLLHCHGPFTLAWLETLLRAADQRASMQPTADKLLQDHDHDHGNDGHQLDESRRVLAQPAARGAAAAPLASNSPSCGQLHGHGGGTSGRGVASGTTRPPHLSTRYIETTAGILTYQQLAPLLAEKVGEAEAAIVNRIWQDLTFEELLIKLHQCICEDLTPDIAGHWRRKDVRVGDHEPPRFYKVPELMHNYVEDLKKRLDSMSTDLDAQLIDHLTFAEGRLLHIHPFEDFNGRVSRLFLIEILYRLNLEIAIDPATASPDEAKEYFAALHAYDNRNSRPLSNIWRRRFERAIIHIHRLDGCAPTPLAHYLKALGILRLVAEQADPEARGWWKEGRFYLATKLTQEELERFFLYDYQPTPFVSPWNKGSGFYKDKDPGLDPIEASTAHRFRAFRAGISESLECAKEISMATDMSAAETKRIKDNSISTLQKSWRGPHREWMDACMVLGDDSTPKYPALLGTGGNDGRFDFTNNFMKRLGEVFDLKSDKGKPQPAAPAWIRGILWDVPIPRNISDKPIGQYLPGMAGGANNANGPDSESLVNPLDFIVMLEGTLVFRSSASRRFESLESSRVATPFVVNACGAAYPSASADDEDARGEQWMPLWSRPSTYGELRRLLAEGRAQVKSKAVREPLELAQAVKRLGVARGITSFQRYGYIERNGQSKLAVPLGRFDVANQASEHLACLDDLDLWLRRLRKEARDKHAPARLLQAEKRLVDALFTITAERSHNPDRWQNVLVQLAAIEAIMRQGTGYGAGPVPRLRPEWVVASKDETPEFRLALAFALQAIRHHWLPLDRKKSWCFAEDRTQPDVVMHGRRGLDDAIALVQRRLAEASQQQGRHLPLKAAPNTAASSTDLAALLAGHVDLDHTMTLARALMALDRKAWNQKGFKIKAHQTSDSPDWPDDAWLAIRLCTLPWPLETRSGFQLDIGTDPAIVRCLAADDAARALIIASRRLRAAGVRCTIRSGAAPPDTARLWAAALAFPITKNTAQRFFDRLSPSTNNDYAH